MKLIKISSVVILVATIAACSTHKKTTTLSTDSSKPNIVDPLNAAKSNNGVPAPGDNELAAMQDKDNNITMRTLKEGYAIYTGTCTSCHGAVNIYKIKEDAWPHILDNMAFKARITDSQKNAVNKYVLAIKATQPK